MKGEEVVEHGEIDSAEDHGEGDDVLLHGGEPLEAVVVDGKTAGGDVGEGDIDRVPDVHAAFPQHGDKGRGEQQIDGEGLLQIGGHGGGLLASVVGT